MANEFKVKKGLIVHGSGSTVLDIQGSQGQLFSITDDLTGTLFAVSDISGVSIFDVNADGTTTLDGNLNLGDNNKLQLGASQDLQMYHDGTNSYIVDAGAGDLLNYYSNDWKVIQYGSSEVSIWARTNEYVKLFYNGNEKLATTNTGVEVTGDVAVGANYIGRDADNYIGFETDNVIKFRTDGIDRLSLDTNQLYPQTTNGLSLGHSSFRFANIYSSQGNFSGNLSTNHIVAASDSLYNIGTTAVRYANIYADNLHGDGSNLTNVTGIVPSNMVTTDTTQSITGAKTLSSLTLSNQNPAITLIDSSGSTYTAQWRFKDNKLQYLWGGGIKAYFTTNGLAIGDQDSSNDAQIVKTGSSPYGLAIKTNNIQALNVDSSQNATFAGSITTETGGSVFGGSGGIPIYARSTGTVSYMQFQTSSTGGNGSSDGLTVGVNGSTAYIWNRENTTLHLGTNDTSALALDNSQNATFAGDVTINKATPILTFNSSNVNVDQGIVFSNAGNFDASIKHGPSSADMVFDIGRNSTWGGAANFKLDTYQTYYMTRNSHAFKILGVDALSINSSSNATFAGTVGLSSNKSVNWPGGSIRAEGNTLKLTATTLIDLQEDTQIQGGLDIKQTSDSDGLQIFGYDDRAADSGNLYIDSAGNFQIRQTHGAGSGYMQIHAENYLELAASSLIYTQANFRIYDAGQLSLGSGGDYKIKYNATPDNLVIHTDDNKGITIDNAGNVTFTEDVVVAGKVTAQEFHTEFVSASIMYESGSTKFGDTSDDNHDFTGSLNIDQGDVNIDSGKFLTMYGNNSTYHGIGSVDTNGNASDDIRINSYHNVFVDLDSNSNNTDTTTFFQISQHSAASTLNTPFFIVRADGRVGINEDSPDSVLHVNTGTGTGNANTVIIDRAGSSDYSGISFATAGTIDWSIGQNSAGNFELFEDGQDAKTRMTVKVDGNVGIGTINPGYKLEVGGTARIHSRLTFGGNVNNFIEGTGSSLDFKSNGEYYFKKGADTHLTILSGGNVGIGITSPTAKLHVVGDGIVSGNLTFKPKEYSSTDDLNNDNRSIFSTHQVNNTTSNRATVYSSVYTLGGGVSNALQISTNEDYNESGMFIRQYNQNGASPQGTGWQNWTEVWTTNHAPLSKITSWDSAYTYSQVGHLPLSAGSGERVTGDLYISDKLYMRPSSTYGNGYKVMDVTGTGNAPYPTILSFSNYGRSSVMVLNDDKVGIGTTSPSYKVTSYSTTAEGSGTNEFPIVAGKANAIGNFTGIGLASYIAANGAVKAGIALERVGSYGTGKLHFLNNDTLNNSDATLSDSKMTILRNGNVGIGTTDPGAKLEVSDTTTGIGAIIGNTTHNSSLQIYTAAAGKNSEIWFGDAADDDVGKIDYDHATNSMSFVVAATKRLSIDAAGTVLLGDNSTAYQTIFFDPTPGTVYGNGTLQVQPTTAPGSGTAQFTTNFADRVGGGTTKHNVRVGGTVTATSFTGDGSNLTNISATDSSKLPLAGGTMNSDATINMNSGQLTSVDYIDFGIGQLNGVSTSNFILKSLGDITYNVDSNDNGNSAHIFQESGNELMRIRYDGKVGIGESSPAARLHIVDNTQFASGQASVEVLKLQRKNTGGDIKATTEGHISMWATDSNNDTEWGRISWVNDNTGDGGLETEGAMSFWTSKEGTLTRAMYINHDQEIGIGTTSPQSRLDVQGGMSQFSTTLTNNEDWENSPISINERGQVGSAQSADKYAPNLNFHWAGRASKSLWLNSTGVLHFGEYSSTGIPDATGTFSVNTVALTGTGRITGVDTVSAGTDATSKTYVDNAITTATGAYLPLAGGTMTGNIVAGGNKYTLTVNAPTSLVTSIVNDTINVTFTASTTTNIDNYLVFSSVAGGDYGLISVIPPADFGATMSIIDDSFNAGGTQAYRVYAVKNGVYSSPLTGTKSFSVGTVEPTNMSVVNLNTAYYIQYDAPSAKGRFVTAYNIYKHEHATQSSLSRNSATLIYSGMNNSYMYQISGNNNNNFHQFWVETTVV